MAKDFTDKLIEAYITPNGFEADDATYSYHVRCYIDDDEVENDEYDERQLDWAKKDALAYEASGEYDKVELVHLIAYYDSESDYDDEIDEEETVVDFHK